MMLRQAHSISWKVLEGTFCGSEALCVTEKVAYSMVKDYESRAGTGLLAAERAGLRVTAWVMRRKRRG